jgi:signal transduction histidine kinase
VQPDKVSEGLTRIDDAVNRMDGQIGELLDTARLQIGQPLDLERVPTDLVRLAQEAVEACRQGAPEHTLEFHPDLPEIVGEWDAPRLRRVVDNLLGNAVKYSPRGSEVRVRVALKVDTAVLQVEDNGIGIPEEDLPHIFEWFYRAGNAPEGVAGTGIGLAGAQHVVQQHGGTIAVESKVGVGTRFTVHLPI